MTRAATFATVLALSGGMVRGARAQEPHVQAWGDSITLEPSGLRIRLPADGIHWEQQSGVSHGDTIRLLVGTLPDGSSLSLQIDVVPARVMGRSAANCGDFFNAMKRGFAQAGAVVRTIDHQAWVPHGSGWSGDILAVGGTSFTACHDGGRHPLSVDTTDDLRDAQHAAAVRTLLWLVGDAARRG